MLGSILPESRQNKTTDRNNSKENLSTCHTGYDVDSYLRRAEGHSPEPIRDSVWNIIGRQVSGVVLDAGSGSGGWIKRLMQSKSVERIISVDLVDDGAGDLEGVEFYLRDLSRDLFPCNTEELDWVFAIEVIEHLANPRHFIAEAHRTLLPNGKLFITTPCNDSLTARLSMLFRGYYPSFCDHDYHESGHITPITELDIKRMAEEANFRQVDFYYPLPGRIPRSSYYWQSLFPGLRGKLWSDSLFALLIK
ncbi:MAG: class I SAM-dependent methyltransferase [Blastocatellales bacterium]